MNVPLFQESDIDEYIKRSYDKLDKEMSEYQGKGSGWTVHKVLSLEVRINQYNPLRGSSYIKLPNKLKKKER
jgi:hypothetical protein